MVRYHDGLFAVQSEADRSLTLAVLIALTAMPSRSSRPAPETSFPLGRVRRRAPGPVLYWPIKGYRINLGGASKHGHLQASRADADCLPHHYIYPIILRHGFPNRAPCSTLSQHVAPLRPSSCVARPRDPSRCRPQRPQPPESLGWKRRLQMGERFSEIGHTLLSPEFSTRDYIICEDADDVVQWGTDPPGWTCQERLTAVPG